VSVGWERKGGGQIASVGLGGHCVVPENIDTPPMEVFFGLNPPPGNSSLGQYFPLKILAFDTPLPPQNFQ